MTAYFPTVLVVRAGVSGMASLELRSLALLNKDNVTIFI